MAQATKTETEETVGIVYTIHRIDTSRFEAVETQGAKRKFWFRQEDNVRTLFKAEDRGTGEDWAEKVVCELCKLLGLPHVHYELAHEYDGESNRGPGVICASCTPGKLSLVLGNQLLLAIDSSYPIDEAKYFHVSQHTIEAVAKAMRILLPPGKAWTSQMPFVASSALDVFVGYVMLDAWVANQDRHHQNWAAILDSDGIRLAPTFDHGASLARNLSDKERNERLSTRDHGQSIATFAGRARSAFYGQESDTRPLGTHEAFQRFGSLIPEIADKWLQQLDSVQDNQIRTILNEVPNKRMTKISKEFTMELLATNRQRLLEANS